MLSPVKNQGALCPHFLDFQMADMKPAATCAQVAGCSSPQASQPRCQGVGWLPPPPSRPSPGQLLVTAVGKAASGTLCPVCLLGALGTDIPEDRSRGTAASPGTWFTLAALSIQSRSFSCGHRGPVRGLALCKPFVTQPQAFAEVVRPAGAQGFLCSWPAFLDLGPQPQHPSPHTPSSLLTYLLLPGG